MSSLTELVPVPPPSAINGKASPCPTSFLIRKYGEPRLNLGDDCKPATSAFWKSRFVTEDVGPFKVTGHRLAVALLRRSLAKVKTKNLELYQALSSAGMLCVRRVRGSKSLLSNHGLGLAIDFKLNGVLDPRGDDKVQRGLLELYAILKGDGWYWGAEFGIEDAMHFEVSAEVVMSWVRSGEF
ncbi:D/-alanyl-D/-alanine carboxypeptidase [Caudoviricetes sp.]|nr:D/-alanyl-D/-alanine carboxypeptidase [Caudoviricetes sp.]